MQELCQKEKLNNFLDYKIIVPIDYYLNILPHNPCYWSFLHEDTMKGEMDVINNNDVYFIGAIIDANLKIGVYVFVNEYDNYCEELKKKHKNKN